MIISHGYISKMIEVLRRVSQELVCCSKEQLLQVNISNLDLEHVLCLSRELEYLGVGNEGWVLREDGQDILNVLNTEGMVGAFRCVIYDYIRKLRPAWAVRIPWGRREAYSMMPVDMQFCVKAVGLMDVPPTTDVISWWDNISSIVRGSTERQMLDTGRAGELLVYEFELLRTGVQPVWASVESNVSGYDIVSRSSRDDPRPRVIEVKSTAGSLEGAVFHLTANEWQVLSSSLNESYVYLLSLEQRMLAMVEIGEMTCHVPTNGGHGEWESVRIPFSAFSGKFQTVSSLVCKRRLDACTYNATS